MLRALIHDDRSWDAIASAMTRAGILFATGKPWTARYLTIELAKATAPLKGYPDRRTSKRGDQPVRSDVSFPAQNFDHTTLLTHLASKEIPKDPMLASALHRVRVPVSKKSYVPPAPLSPEEETQRDIIVARARKAMRGEN